MTSPCILARVGEAVEAPVRRRWERVWLDGRGGDAFRDWAHCQSVDHSYLPTPSNAYYKGMMMGYEFYPKHKHLPHWAALHADWAACTARWRAGWLPSGLAARYDD